MTTDSGHEIGTYLTCPVSGCKRRVGPYFDVREANAAMFEHHRWSHLNFQRRRYEESDLP